MDNFIRYTISDCDITADFLDKFKNESLDKIENYNKVGVIMNNLLNFITSSGNTVFEMRSGGKFVIVELIENKNSFLLVTVPKKQFKKGNLDMISNFRINKNLIHGVKSYQSEEYEKTIFELTLKYHEYKLGLYSLSFWKEEI